MPFRLRRCLAPTSSSLNGVGDEGRVSVFAVCLFLRFFGAGLVILAEFQPLEFFRRPGGVLRLRLGCVRRDGLLDLRADLLDQGVGLLLRGGGRRIFVEIKGLAGLGGLCVPNKSIIVLMSVVFLFQIRTGVPPVLHP